MLMTNGMPFCSATWAIAVVWPESKAPTRSCAPSLISFSARARATSTLVSVSAFMIARSGRPRSLKIAVRDLDAALAVLPMLACAPERGSSTPTFSGAALRADDVERRGAGEHSGGAGAGGEGAAGDARASGIRFADHVSFLPGCGDRRWRADCPISTIASMTAMQWAPSRALTRRGDSRSAADPLAADRTILLTRTTNVVNINMAALGAIAPVHGACAVQR